MEPDTTYVCTSHRVRVEAGPGGSLAHIGGNCQRHCSSQKFTVTTRRQAGRDEVVAAMAADREKETADA